MAKSNKSSKPTSKSVNRNRPNPLTPKAGYTQTRRRYGDGGKISK